ncbi:MAG: hypothetical protein ACLTSG_09390 [Lachnospiraceae bacterium]
MGSNYDPTQVLAEEEALESDIQSMIAELERQEAANSITSTGTYIWPLPGYSPGSAYGWRMHPIFNEMRFHAGEDIGAPTGTPIPPPTAASLPCKSPTTATATATTS